MMADNVVVTDGQVLSKAGLSELCSVLKGYIGSASTGALKTVKYSNNTLTFQTEAEDDVVVGTTAAAATINLPEEQFLDQAKTTFVNSFAWSETTYPNSTDPSLDGQPVLVLAVKGDSTVSYSFVSLKTLYDVYTGDATNTITVTINATTNVVTADLKIDTTNNGALQTSANGVYVATIPASDIQSIWDAAVAKT